MNVGIPEQTTSGEVGTDVRLKGVLAVLCGEPLGTVARRLGIDGALLERCHRQFLTAGTAAIAHDRPVGREEAVLRFYSAVAEDLRRGLGALGGWVELLAASGGEEAAEAAGAAREVLDHLRALCDDARDSAGVTLGQVELRTERVDLSALVQAVARSCSGVQFSSPGPVPVDGDRGRLLQVVRSMVNAARLCGEPVTAAVLRRPSSWAELTVTIDDFVPFAVVQELFGPFGLPGAGTRLSISRALVTAHGGQMGAHVDGASTTLWLRLPEAGAGHPSDPGDRA